MAIIQWAETFEACMTRFLFVALLLQLPSCKTGHLHAQTANADAWTPSNRPIADYLSLGIAAGTIGADFVYEVKQGSYQHRVKAAILCDLLKVGSVNLAATGLKELFPRERPDGSDNNDSFSEHTANVTITGGPWPVRILVGGVVAYLRTAANKHDLVGVLEGFGLGLADQFLVTRIPQCKGLS